MAAAPPAAVLFQLARGDLQALPPAVLLRCARGGRGGRAARRVLGQLAQERCVLFRLAQGGRGGLAARCLVPVRQGDRRVLIQQGRERKGPWRS